MTGAIIRRKTGHGEADVETQEENVHVTLEAEIKVMQAKECQELLLNTRI